MDAFIWLHLSDLHWGQTGQKHLWPNVRQAFFDDLGKLHPKCGPWHVVLFTGDLVQKGDQFDEMEDAVLEPLWERLRKLGSKPALLAVPGNHDLQRPKKDPPRPAVRWLLRKGGFQEIAKDEFWDAPNSEYRKVIEKALSNYQGWWAKRPYCGKLKIKDGLLPGDYSATIETEGGHRIGILGLNTTFLQLAEGDYRERLAWDMCQFHAACDGDGVAWTEAHDVCVLMTHQGPDWLDKTSRDKIYAEINPAGRFVVHLFGHMHEEVIRGESYGGGALLRKWQGPSLFGLEHYGDQEQEDRRHGYCAGRLVCEDNVALLRHWPRRATLDPNGWRFVPDHEKCVLEDDGGTREERVEYRLTDTTGSPADESASDDFGQTMSRALENFHRSVQNEWDNRWAPPVDEGHDE